MSQIELTEKSIYLFWSHAQKRGAQAQLRQVLDIMTLSPNNTSRAERERNKNRLPPFSFFSARLDFVERERERTLASSYY
jgi:hypothetical protein